MSDSMIRFNGGHLEVFNQSNANFKNDLINTTDGTSMSKEKAKEILSSSNDKEKARTLLSALSQELLNTEAKISAVKESFDMYNNADESKKHLYLAKIEEKRQILERLRAEAKAQAQIIDEAMKSLNTEYLNNSELTGLIANIRNFTNRARD